MLLRWLVGNVVRQAAERKVHDLVSAAAQGLRHAASSSGESQSSDESQSEPVTTPPVTAPCDAAIMFAIGVESGATVDMLTRRTTTQCHSYLEHFGYFANRPVILAESGVGSEAARKATSDLLACHKPAWLISAGFASALDERLRRGHVVMADSVTSISGERLSIGLKIDSATIEQTPGLHTGRLLTVDHVVRDPQERRELAARHAAIACDMETLAVAEACREHKVRFLSVRVITDTVDDRLPPEVEKMLDQKSLAGKLGAAAGAAFGRPASLKDAWKLRESALKASERLARFLSGTLPQLD